MISKTLKQKAKSHKAFSRKSVRSVSLHNELDVMFCPLRFLLPDSTFFLRVYFPNINPPVKIEWRPLSSC